MKWKEEKYYRFLLRWSGSDNRISFNCCFMSLPGSITLQLFQILVQYIKSGYSDYGTGAEKVDRLREKVWKCEYPGLKPWIKEIDFCEDHMVYIFYYLKPFSLNKYTTIIFRL